MKKAILSVFAIAMFSTVSAQAQTAAQANTQPPNSENNNTQTATTKATDTSTASNSQTDNNASAATPAAIEETKTLITVEELPEGVKNTLASPTLKVWTAYEAYLIKESDGKEYYAINIKKDTQTGSVRLDKEGKPVK